MPRGLENSVLLRISSTLKEIEYAFIRICEERKNCTNDYIKFKNQKMGKKDYQAVIKVDNSKTTAFDSIANGVNKWWAKNFEGSSNKPGDEFTVHFGDTFVKFKVTEFISDQKIEWTVIDCYLPFINDKTEWNDTKIIFEFEQKGKQIQITMTHVGLVPEAECYAVCSVGWDGHIKSSLYKLLSEGVGQPE
jgi:Activator of Hsp90 ATPase homolog 1-like protein